MKKYNKDLPASEITRKLSVNHFNALIAYREHNDYDFAAQALGLKLGTFKSRLNRARKMVKQIEEKQNMQPAV